MKARVLWEIDVDVVDGNALDCAREAFAAITRPGSEATVFDVYPEEGQPIRVDLTEDTITPVNAVCELVLMELDLSGNPIGSKPEELSVAALGDIVSHARQLAVLEREHDFLHGDTATCFSELKEALVAAGLYERNAFDV